MLQLCEIDKFDAIARRYAEETVSRHVVPTFFISSRDTGFILNSWKAFREASDFGVFWDV